MHNINLLAIDIAKHLFQLHGVDKTGKTVFTKQLHRSKLMNCIANVPPCIIAMEACSGANYWARQFKKLGHEVKLISPQFVKPFVQSNKNDRNDCHAIAEAASRPHMRFVPIKAIEQQDIQSLHRIRERLLSHRTALMNQLRGLLAEYGLIIPQGQAALRRLLPEFLEDAENELTPFTRLLCQELYEELMALNDRIKNCDKKIQHIFNENKMCQRIAEVEGIGPITATAIVSDLSEPHHFKNGRHYASYLGLVPRQHSSGGKQQLLGISKRGDSYLRKLLIHGARSVVLSANKKHDKKSLWIQQLKMRRGANCTCVALANKNARILWSLLAYNKEYKKAA
jgi:transposase